MSFLLIGYVVFILVVSLFGIAGVYHTRFGFPGDKTRLGVFLYLVAVAAIIAVSVVLIGTTDWSEDV